MNSMTPKRLKVLVTGLALMIFGPLLGWVLHFLVIFWTTQTNMQKMVESARSNPFAFPDFSQMTSGIFTSFIPLIAGIACGAVGFFITCYTLLSHFFGPNPQPTSPCTTLTEAPRPTKPANETRHDSRYMPKV